MQPNSYTNASLEELLILYRQSDPDAFREFFKRTSKLVFNFLRLKLSGSTEAEDVMQDTYFRVHRYISSYDESRGALAWLMSIARNAMLDHVRTKKGLSHATSLDHLDLATNEIGSEKLTELRQFVDQACLDLSKDERELLFQRVILEASYEEIATDRGIGVENARQKISRLLKRLRSGVTTP